MDEYFETIKKEISDYRRGYEKYTALKKALAGELDYPIMWMELSKVRLDMEINRLRLNFSDKQLKQALIKERLK